MPSYITSVSALSFRKLISQIPNEVFCATAGAKKSFSFNNTKINIIHTKHFSGFKKEKYEGFDILAAEPEKAIIDSFSVIPISIFEEAFLEIDENRMIALLKKIKKSSIIKRIGYLMEKNGFDVYPKLKKLINYKYIALEPLSKASGIKNKKWGLIINTK
jgi:predicted transcriptional regulator of viral defense system